MELKDRKILLLKSTLESCREVIDEALRDLEELK